MSRRLFSVRHHAIVIGASLAGLLAARVLADHFEIVTLVERDSISNQPHPRKGVPQGNHVHGLLAKGMDILTRLFPDLVQTLTAGGAVPVDMGADFRWHHFGTWKVRFDSGIGGILFTRPFLEVAIAERVRALPNVRVLAGAVDQLCFDADRKRITGVQMHSQDTGANMIAADLIVDASGRSSRMPQWLEANGYARPEESTVKVNVTYASRLYRLAPRHADLKALMVYARPPGKTMGALFAVEGNRWLVTLGGFHGVQAPADEAGYLAYARDLPVPEIHEALVDAEPLTSIATYRFATSLRRHYERMASFPDGLLVMGDAACSFNPIYGQGMTVSALEAIALDGLLSGQTDGALGGFSCKFQKSVAALVDVPWQLTTGEDFRHPETVGQRPPGAAFLHWYTGRLHERCGRDASLALAFYRVMHMLEPPTTLFRPSVAARVLLGRAAAVQNRALPFGPAQPAQAIPEPR